MDDTVKANTDTFAIPLGAIFRSVLDFLGPLEKGQ